MWAEQAGEENRGQRDGGEQSTPTDGTAITLPREEASTLSTLLSDAVVGGAGEGKHKACFASTSEEPQQP